MSSSHHRARTPSPEFNSAEDSFLDFAENFGSGGRGSVSGSGEEADHLQRRRSNTPPADFSGEDFFESSIGQVGSIGSSPATTSFDCDGLLAIITKQNKVEDWMKPMLKSHMKEIVKSIEWQIQTLPIQGILLHR